MLIMEWFDFDPPEKDSKEDRRMDDKRRYSHDSSSRLGLPRLSLFVNIGLHGWAPSGAPISWRSADKDDDSAVIEIEEEMHTYSNGHT